MVNLKAKILEKIGRNRNKQEDDSKGKTPLKGTTPPKGERPASRLSPLSSQAERSASSDKQPTPTVRRVALSPASSMPGERPAASGLQFTALAKKNLESPALGPNGIDLKGFTPVRPPTGCPVCYNLDPEKAPNDEWAKDEYILPVQRPAGKITISNSSIILDMAGRGCLHCGLLCSAISSVHPGWEKSKSFLEIFLAAYLPIILRLNFGTYTTHGRWSINVREPGISPKEIELYRTRVRPEHTTVADVMLEPIYGTLGYAEHTPLHLGDAQSFDFIRKHVYRCINEHSCGKEKGLPLLPERVLWLNDNGGYQVVEPMNTRAKYFALSYCWAPKNQPTLLTTRSNLAERKIGIAFDEFPPLLKDVVKCAREMEIQYIWIDRLCIIQGDKADFEKQAPKMGEYYGHATLTIVAGSIESEQSHILVDRDHKGISSELLLGIDNIGSLLFNARFRSHNLGTEKRGGDYGRISTRAWTWQERLLSTRAVTFTASGLKFECQSHSTWHGFDAELYGHSWSSNLGNMTHLKWLGLVEEFSSRDITHTADRQPAMLSVLKRIEDSTGWTQHYAHWHEHIIESLAWTSESHRTWGLHSCRVNESDFPTWSWANLEGGISYLSAKPNISRGGPIFQLQFRGFDATKRLLKVSGYAATGELHANVWYEKPKPDDVPETDYWRCHYRFKFSDMDLECGVRGDVPLEPGNVTIDGKTISTVGRTSLKGKPPATSWSASCLYLLLAVRPYDATCAGLFLVRSLRDFNSWERVGFMDGPEVSPAVFAGRQKTNVDIL